MDEFAQSREDDDLFADEFEPIAQPTTVVETPISQPAETPTPPTGPAKNGSRGGHGQERRGRGGRGGQNGLNQSRYAPQTQPEATPAAQQDTPSEPPQAPTEIARITAVRGDRSATGGTMPKKLTEEELTAKLEQMAILNAKKSETHRRTEADQAAFQHREKELAKERKEKLVEEKKNRSQMEAERAKNRQRKMQAQGGREWDSEKVESDIVDGKGRGRSSEYVRGGHGGVIRGRGAGLSASRFADEEVVDAPKGRGGFEGRGRGRGRGRGGKVAQVVPSVDDFPSLPTASKVEEVKSPVGPAGDWAEEMATPVEEKKLAAEILEEKKADV